MTILLDNAVKYSSDKSNVTLTSSKYKRSLVRISVKDEGIGISRTDQDKIFNRFYRSDEARSRDDNGGYGLGLEIARNIAERHGGSIELKSRVGSGSTFSLVLPASKLKKSN